MYTFFSIKGWNEWVNELDKARRPQGQILVFQWSIFTRFFLKTFAKCFQIPFEFPYIDKNLETIENKGQKLGINYEKISWVSIQWEEE